MASFSSSLRAPGSKSIGMQRASDSWWANAGADLAGRRGREGNAFVPDSTKSLVIGTQRAAPRIPQQLIIVSVTVRPDEYARRRMNKNPPYPLTCGDDVILNKSDLVLCMPPHQTHTNTYAQRNIVGSANGLSIAELDSLGCPGAYTTDGADHDDPAAAMIVNGPVMIYNTGDRALEAGFPVYLDNPPVHERPAIMGQSKDKAPAFQCPPIGGRAATKFLWTTRPVPPGRAGITITRVEREIADQFLALSNGSGWSAMANKNKLAALRTATESSYKTHCTRMTDPTRCPVYRYWQFYTSLLCASGEREDVAKWFYDDNELLVPSFIACLNKKSVPGDLTQFRQRLNQSSSSSRSLSSAAGDDDAFDQLSQSLDVFCEMLRQGKLHVAGATGKIITWFTSFRSRVEAAIYDWRARRMIGTAMQTIAPGAQGLLLLGQRYSP